MRRMAGLLSLLALVLGTGTLAVARTPDVATTSDLPLIKAALVYNISKFVEWPAEHLDAESFVVGVVGRGVGGPDLQSLVGKTLHDAPVEVVIIDDAQDLTDCHVLYVGSDAMGDWPGLRVATIARGILAVSDLPGFAAAGGVVELVLDDDRLRFVINKGAAQSARLTISSQVLKIAMSVIDGE